MCLFECLSRQRLGPSTVAVSYAKPLHLGMCVPQDCVLDWICLVHLYLPSHVYPTDTEHLRPVGVQQGMKQTKVLTLVGQRVCL